MMTLFNRSKLKPYSNTESIFVSKTTLLEFEWVLRSAYRLTRESILHSILTICGLPNLTVENAWQVAQACELYSKGFDFADALHYYSANTNVIIQQILTLKNSTLLMKNLLETASC